jgi:hypothetical protein
MIVETMTDEEVFKEIHSDLEAAQKFSQANFTSHKYRKIIMTKGNEPFCLRPVEWTSNKRNTYFLFFNGESKSKVLKGGLASLMIIYIRHKHNGLHAYFPCDDDDYGSIFTPHFFQKLQ